MDTLAEKARAHHKDRLSPEEIEALARRQIPYQTAVQMVCDEMQCAHTSFYRYYKGLLKPFSLGGGGRRARFCWEDEVLRAIAAVKGAAPTVPSPSPTPPSPLEKPV